MLYGQEPVLQIILCTLLSFQLTIDISVKKKLPPPKKNQGNVFTFFGKGLVTHTVCLSAKLGLSYSL